MSQTTPPTITAAPADAPQRNDRSTFSTRVDAFVTWLIAAVAQFAAVATNVYNNAVDAYNSATAAAASAATAVAATNATVWVSGTTYAIGDGRYSPVNFQTYRRRTAGAGTTDPSLDPTNWERLSFSPPAWVTKTATYTPLAGGNDRVKADTQTTGAFPIPFPAAPSDGDTFEVMDVKAYFDTNNLTLTGNGNTIMGYTTFVCNTKRMHKIFTYNAADTDWKM